MNSNTSKLSFYYLQLSYINYPLVSHWKVMYSWVSCLFGMNWLGFFVYSLFIHELSKVYLQLLNVVAFFQHWAHGPWTDRVNVAFIFMHVASSLQDTLTTVLDLWTADYTTIARISLMMYVAVVWVVAYMIIHVWVISLRDHWKRHVSFWFLITWVTSLRLICSWW